MFAFLRKALPVAAVAVLLGVCSPAGAAPLPTSAAVAPAAAPAIQDVYYRRYYYGHRHYYYPRYYRHHYHSYHYYPRHYYYRHYHYRHYH